MNNHIFRALSEKQFLLLWLGEVFTQVSINLFNFLLILIVFSLTQSNTAVSGIVVTFTIPAIIFGTIAGAYVDRWNKRSTLIVTNILRAFLLIFLAFFHTNIVLIYIISLCISVLTQFFIPAETPLIPLVVKNNLLFSANALFGMGIYGSILIAYVLSGPLLIYFGEATTFIILALLLGLGGLFISFINLPNKETLQGEQNASIKNNRRAILDEIRQVVEVISKTKDIYNSLFLLALSQILILVVAVLTPGYASQVLRISIKEFPIMFVAPAAIGMLLGAIILVHYFHNYSKEKIMTIGLFFASFAMLMLPFGSRVVTRDFVQTINAYLPHFFSITVYHIMVVLAFILGLANALVFVPSSTILQEKTSDESRGKIYGFLNTIVGIFSLVPILLVGGLSDLIGVGKVIVGIGICLAILAISRVVMRSK